MQINTSLQATNFNSPFDEASEKPEAKAKNDLKVFVQKGKTSEKLNELTSVLEENDISLTFSQDKETKTLVVKLVDKGTGEEIRQIPTEVSLKLTAINAKIQGNFVDEKS